MKHKISTIVTRLGRHNTHMMALMTGLIVASSLFIGPVDPTLDPMSDSLGRKSRSGRWTDFIEPSITEPIKTIL